MANEIWLKRKAMLEDEFARAAMAVYEHMGHPSAFAVPMAPDSDYLVGFGTREDLIGILTSDKSQATPYLGDD